MAQVRNSDLRISGRIKAGNITSGIATITPVANTPTSLAITGLSLKGTGTITALCTGVSSVPGSEVVEVSTNNITSAGMNVWIYRTNTTSTKVGWLMWRKRA